MINKVTIVGRVGQDPILKNTQQNTPFTRISIATTEYVKEKEITEWHNVTVFGKTSEIVCKYVQKGSLVYVDGKIRSGEYVNKDGQKIKTFGIICETIKFLSPKNTLKPSNNNIDNNIEDIPF